jgi:hypothetical protein
VSGQVHLSGPSLARVGVTLENGPRPALGCAVCGDAWVPVIDAGGKLSRGWWLCPHGCNRVHWGHPATRYPAARS